MRNPIVSNVLGLAGAAVGGIVGYSIFGWILRQGFYGLMIPGALLGLGCSLVAQHRSIARGIVCGVAALVLGMYTEWRHFPLKDPSFTYLVTHFHQETPITILMVVLGAVFGFWMGKDANPLFGSPGRPGPGKPANAAAGD